VKSTLADPLSLTIIRSVSFCCQHKLKFPINTMPVDIILGGVISCLVCSLCGAFCLAKNKQRPRRGPVRPCGPQEQMMYDQQQQEGINEMELLMQHQILAEKEEVERLRNYIRRQKRAAADAILRQQSGLTLATAPVVPTPVAPAPVQPMMAMNGLPPRMVVCNPNPGYCAGQPMMSPFPQMPNPNMPPPPVPVYYLR
jgi:hypothetical protein